MCPKPPMPRRLSRLWPALLLGLFIPATVSAAISIATTIRPLHFIARAVAGDEVDIISIIDVNDSPHHFTLSPSDRLSLEASDLLLWAGPEIEVDLQAYFRRLEDSDKVISATGLAGLVLLQHEDGETDPHFWLNPDNATLIARELALKLASVDPASASEYQQNADIFIDNITGQVAELERRISALQNPAVLVYHNAYQYFEERFGLQHELALVHNPEVSPGMRETIAMRNAIAESEASCLLLEPDHNPDLLATLLQGKTIDQIEVDPLGYGIADTVDSYSMLLESIATAYEQCKTASN